MANRKSMTAFILALSFVCVAIAACDTQTDRTAPEGGVTVSPTATMTPMMSPTTTPGTSPVAGLSSYDQEFMMNAARSGMMEVQLGNMAAQKASSNDVKRLGQRVATDHGKANQMLQQLASNLNVTLPQEMQPDQQQEISRLQDLSGKEFDREFVSLMLRNHAKDISEYERAANQATNADLKRYASQVLPILREHAQLARSVASKVGIKPSPTQ